MDKYSLVKVVHGARTVLHQLEYKNDNCIHTVCSEILGLKLLRFMLLCNGIENKPKVDIKNNRNKKTTTKKKERKEQKKNWSV